MTHRLIPPNFTAPPLRLGSTIATVEKSYHAAPERFWWWRPPKPEPTPPPAVQPPIGPENLLGEVNLARVKHGLMPIPESSCLSGQSQAHSQNQKAAEDPSRPGSGLSHDGMTGRLIACGNPAGSENVAWAIGMTPAEVVDLWMSSTVGHRENILGDWGLAGVGQFQWYWTLMFSQGDADETPPPNVCPTCGTALPSGGSC